MYLEINVYFENLAQYNLRYKYFRSYLKYVSFNTDEGQIKIAKKIGP